MIDYTTSKLKRAEFVLDSLEEYYPELPVFLEHTDPYTLLIAVLLSAQCTDERVNKITPILFKMANTPEEMVKHTVEEIKEIIRPCGLSPRKSKAIWELSKMIIELHDGEVPASFEHLEAMPGVGHKTASVVMSQAFGVASFPVDTHIHRLAQNWKLTTGKSIDQTEKDLKRLFPKERWSKLHLQIILYGREYCTARGCKGLVCPICTTLYPNRKRAIVKKG